MSQIHSLTKTVSFSFVNRFERPLRSGHLEFDREGISDGLMSENENCVFMLILG